MRSLLEPDLARLRIPAEELDEPWRTATLRRPETGGAFRVERRGVLLWVMVGIGRGWDHVSVHARPRQSSAALMEYLRAPTWAEMEHVKRLFFRPNETAMQLHVPPTNHVNLHPHVLHLWRPHRKRIPRPPQELV